ncbi:MAG: MFS transporter [Candidatus Hodarchaeota archaeon]
MDANENGESFLSKVPEKFKIPTGTKLKFGVGSLGYAMSSGVFAAWLTNFYIKILEINYFQYGLAWILYLVWNSINDPLIGLLEDKTRTRIGRRKPWLIVATPLIGLSLIFLFFPPANLDPGLDSTQWIYFTWLFSGLMLYDLFYTIVGISENALVAELTIHPVERANTNLFWSIGQGLGQVFTFVIPFFYIVDKPGIPYKTNFSTIQFFILVFGILGSIFLAIFSLGIKEKKIVALEKRDEMGLLESLKTTIKNKGFLIYSVLLFVMTFFYTIAYSQLTFLVQDVLQISSDDFLSFTPIVSFLGSSLIGFPVGISLNKRYGGKKATMYLLCILIIGLILLTFSFNVWWANITLVIVGIGNAGAVVVYSTLMGDVIDKDELDTGYRREGAYFGSAAFFTKPAQSVAAGIVALVFSLTNYVQGASEQSFPAKFGILLTIGLIPAAFMIFGLLVLRKFPFDASTEEYQAMKNKIDKHHDAVLKRQLDSSSLGS